MRQFVLLGLLCLCVSIVTSSKIAGFDEAVENVKQAYPHVTDEEANEMVQIMHKRLQSLETEGKLKHWNTPAEHNFKSCGPVHNPLPTDNIYELKPGHISIVASMGDSITAGFGASSLSILGIKEWRGQSWSIGGDADELTFPNSLVSFVGELGLYGPSLGCGKRDNPDDFLNAAVSGSIVQDMPGQAIWLAQRIAELGADVFQKQWKVITIWVGGNNLCVVCRDQEAHSPDVYEKNLNDAVRVLSRIPRTFVNLVPSLDVTELSRFSAGFCKWLHPYECPCATTSEESKAVVKSTNAEYTKRIYKISEEWNNMNRTDFAVVVQPFLIKTDIPDETYLSAADCFHPSKKSHRAIAVALWNSMIAPASEKAYEWVPGEPIVCPDNTTKFWVN